LCYDIASRESFNSLQNWLTDARNLASPNIFIVLVGNKKDLESNREVSFQEAEDFARENELIFIECSALTGDAVEEAFLKCARSILTCIENGNINPDRVGSGIQYGDLFLRNLQQLNNEKQLEKQQKNFNCIHNASCSI
jgi:Ras-related protein Rab-4B